MPAANRVNILGVGLSVLNQGRARAVLFDAVEQGRRGYVTVTGVHGVTECQTDPTLRDIHNRALLCTPDGMPMVWLGRLRGHKEMARVYGPDLMLNLCEHSVARGYPHFFYGGNPGVAAAGARWKTASPACGWSARTVRRSARSTPGNARTCSAPLPNGSPTSSGWASARRNRSVSWRNTCRCSPARR